MPDIDLKEFHAAIGEIISNAANTDLILFNTFWRIAKCTLATATSIYYEIIPINVRANIILNVGKHACSPNELTLVNEIIDAAKISNNQRNAVAHSAKALVRGKHLTINPKFIKQPAKPISLATFTGLIVETRAQMERAGHAFDALCMLRGLQPRLFVAQDM